MSPKLTTLPPEVLNLILSHLSPPQLCTVAAVSRTLRETAQTDELWSRFLPFSDNPRHYYLLSCAWRSGRGIHTEMRLLSNLRTSSTPPTIPPVITSLDVTRFPVQCMHMEKEDFITVGSAGGEVVRVNLQTSHKQFFIGPCSCPVSAVCVNNTVIIAGFAHCIPGNGHTSGAVAWNHTGSRLATFGGSGMRSSWAFPTPAVRSVILANERVCLVCDGIVRVYEIGSWKCLTQVSFGHVVKVDMDNTRLAMVVMKDGFQVLHVIDFEKALTRWPYQVELIQQQQR